VAGFASIAPGPSAGSAGPDGARRCRVFFDFSSCPDHYFFPWLEDQGHSGLRRAMLAPAAAGPRQTGLPALMTQMVDLGAPRFRSSPHHPRWSAQARPRKPIGVLSGGRFFFQPWGLGPARPVYLKRARGPVSSHPFPFTEPGKKPRHGSTGHQSPRTSTLTGCAFFFASNPAQKNFFTQHRPAGL